MRKMREIVDMVIKEYGEMTGDYMDIDCDAPDSLHEEYLEYLSDQSIDATNDDDANDDWIHFDDDDDYYDDDDD